MGPRSRLRPSWLVAGLLSATWPSLSGAALVVLDSFDPLNAGELCGVGFDSGTGNVWVYQCSASDIQQYAATGAFVSSVTRPGGSANDVDLDFSPAPSTLGSTALLPDTLLFVDGESGPAEIYAVDEASGAVLATLATAFGASHVVGGAYHPERETFFLVQDSVPGGGAGDVVAEIDPVTGAVLGSFRPVESGFSLFYGDLEVSAANGHLFLVSSAEEAVAEFTPAGVLVQEMPLPDGVSSLSGIGLDDANGEGWVSGTGGTVWRIEGFPAPEPTIAALRLGTLGGLVVLGLARRRAPASRRL